MDLHFVLRSTKTTETPLTPLKLSIKILQLVKYIDNDADKVDRMALFNVLKEDGKANTCDLDFMNKIKERRMRL